MARQLQHYTRLLDPYCRREEVGFCRSTEFNRPHTPILDTLYFQILLHKVTNYAGLWNSSGKRCMKNIPQINSNTDQFKFP